MEPWRGGVGATTTFTGTLIFIGEFPSQAPPPLPPTSDMETSKLTAHDKHLASPLTLQFCCFTDQVRGLISC